MMEEKCMRAEEIGLNIGNSIFPGFNDKQGLMLCGYEWGNSKKDQEAEKNGENRWKPNGKYFVFSNKGYGLENSDAAEDARYDKNIIKWFKLWGHPLSTDGHGGDFEKCIVQTNWCDSQSHSTEAIERKLLVPHQVDNFIAHLQFLEPKLIIFFGSKLLRVMQNNQVIGRVENLLGKKLNTPEFFYPIDGVGFNIGFQAFERAQVVCLPHASGSYGVKDEYIALSSGKIGPLITEFKSSKGIF